MSKSVPQSPYPVHFVQRVKEALPQNSALHSALDRGLGDIVERFLSKFARGEILAEEVLILVRARHVDELIQSCERLQHLRDIYLEWMGIYRQQQRGQPHGH